MTARAPAIDPVLAAWDAAPADDRALSSDEANALAEARAEIARGEVRVMSAPDIEAWFAAQRRASGE